MNQPQSIKFIDTKASYMHPDSERLHSEDLSYQIYRHAHEQKWQLSGPYITQREHADLKSAKQHASKAQKKRIICRKDLPI